MTCPDCHQDTLRDAAGRCLWCHPAMLMAARYCEECDALLERPVHNQRFCGLRCKRKHWVQTDAGRLWLQEKYRRRNSVRPTTVAGRRAYAQRKAAA